MASLGLRLVAFTSVVALAIVGLGEQAAAQRCVIRGEDVEIRDVSIKPQASRAFRATVQGAVSVTLPSAAGQPAVIEVDQGIAFAGTYRDTWYTVTRKLTTGHGMVEVWPGALLTSAHGAGGDAVLSVVFENSDALYPGERPPQILLRGVRVPCNALALDWTTLHEADDEVADTDDMPEEPQWWTLRSPARPLRLRSEPRADAPSVVISAQSCGDDSCFVGEQTATRPGWVQISAGGYEVRVTGWAYRSQLKKLAEEPGQVSHCEGHDGEGGYGCGYGKGYTPPLTMVGPARVRVGTKVSADDGRGPWATVTHEGPFSVRYVVGSEWAAIDVPGFAEPRFQWHASIPVSAILEGPPGPPKIQARCDGPYVVPDQAAP